MIEIQLKKFKMWFYSRQLTQNMTSRQIFFCFGCSSRVSECFDFWTKIYRAKINVEFLSNHDVKFWVDWRKNNCFWKRTKWRTHAHRTHVRKCFLQTHRTRSSVYVRFFCNSQLEKEQPVKNYFIVVIAFAFEY